MLEMVMTVLIVLLIVVVIALIISIFANITIGTPTPINVLVRPISDKIGEIVDDRTAIKRSNEYENKKSKNVKTYELAKEKTHAKEVHKEVSKDHKPTIERTYEEPTVTKSHDKSKTLKK